MSVAKISAERRSEVTSLLAKTNGPPPGIVAGDLAELELLWNSGRRHAWRFVW
jgi:hypothetical protein